MKLAMIIGALILVISAPLSARPAKVSGDVMDRLSVDQLMRLSTLPPARIAEMRCAGFGLWLAENLPTSPKSPTRPAVDRLSADVEAAIANDADLPIETAHELVAAIAADAGIKAKDEGEQALLAEVDRCGSLYAAAASPARLKLHPLAVASVVNPALASCYAQYRVAAKHSDGEEAKALNASANEARDLAVKNKSDAARAAAEVSLEAEFRALEAASETDRQAVMMRLIMCQPAMDRAARDSG
jgi:hypothetical protein